MQDEGLVVAVAAVEHQRQGLAVLRRRALHVEELRRMGDRLEDDDDALRQVQRDDGAFARRQLQHPEHEIIDAFCEVLFRQVDRSEEHTSELQSLMRISYAASSLKKKTNK